MSFFSFSLDFYFQQMIIDVDNIFFVLLCFDFRIQPSPYVWFRYSKHESHVLLKIASN
jgi:hypothetical protein